MELAKARAIADEVVEKLQPFCERLEIAGSIRRQKSIVRDIDIVCMPSNQGQFAYALQQLGKIKMGGGKIIRLDMLKPTELNEGFTKLITLDVYIATPETWATLLLIRTGSTGHNIKLCKRALQMGMKLHADGSGLFDSKDSEGRMSNVESQGVRVAGDTEESIFKALELPYLAPEKRECK